MISLKTKLAGYREVTRFLYGHKTLGRPFAIRLLRRDGEVLIRSEASPSQTLVENFTPFYPQWNYQLLWLDRPLMGRITWFILTQFKNSFNFIWQARICMHRVETTTWIFWTLRSSFLVDFSRALEILICSFRSISFFQAEQKTPFI